MKKNIIVGQSGGPTAVINCSLYGVLKEAFEQSEIGTVYGMVHGIEGLLNGEYLDLGKVINDNSLEQLIITPGAYLGICRYRLPEENEEIYKKIFQKLDQLNIGYFLYIGGNDSMDTVNKLSRYAKKKGSDICFIGIPKTIDNDLVLTDHTPGYGSAARFVAGTVQEIMYDAASYRENSITIIEIMGRNAGWLTAAGALAGKRNCERDVFLVLPEIPFCVEKFLWQVEKSWNQKGHLTICVSEGVKDEEGRVIGTSKHSPHDMFGHKKLGGSGSYLEDILKKNFACRIRKVEFGIPQRCSSAWVSKNDQEEAIEAGKYGLYMMLTKRETGKMVTFERVAGEKYKIEYSLKNVSKICNREKKIPCTWISEDGTSVNQKFFNYIEPLLGESLPRFLKR